MPRLAVFRLASADERHDGKESYDDANRPNWALAWPRACTCRLFWRRGTGN